LWFLEYKKRSHCGKNPADYTIAVHVRSSHLLALSLTGSALSLSSSTQHLDVVIDGQKYELEAWPLYVLLPVGDYKARLSNEKIAKNREYSRVYELLFADGATRRYTVLGESE
jgi:hypothetical protein